MRIVVILCLIFLASCINNKQQLSNFPGRYTAQGKYFLMELLINRDGTFSILEKSMETTSFCSGEWNYLGKDSFQIQCKDTLDPIQSIANSYYAGYSKILFFKKNTILINNTKLKRE